MIALNITATGTEQTILKDYLQNNMSEMLAEKINNGARIIKDGKTLINKKDIDGFMKYATDEARKLADKGSNSACVEDNIVYGWAIHYFEEDTIEGILYNEDGSEFKPVIKAKTIETRTIPPIVKKKEKPQMSFFDLDIEDEETKPTKELINEKVIDEETGEILSEKVIQEFNSGINETILQSKIIKPNPVGTPLYLKFVEYQSQYPDAIVVMRLGDFYEFLGDKACVVAHELDLTLTGRDCGLEERVINVK